MQGVAAICGILRRASLWGCGALTFIKTVVRVFQPPEHAFLAIEIQNYAPVFLSWVALSRITLFRLDNSGV